MTPDPDPTTRPATEPDDDALAALVKATARDWTLPPQRLDAATWRDRVTTSKGGRRGWLPRLAAPLSAAVAVTVVLAFAGVWLSTPRSGPIAGASSSPTSASATAAAPSTSTPPAVVVNGSLPDPTTVLVRAGEDYKLADLGGGALGPSVFGTNSGATVVVARPAGGWLCVCADWGSDTGGTGRVIVKLATAGPTGLPGSETVVREIVGRVDPNLPTTAQDQLVDARASITRDGRYALLGWAARDGADGWKLGIDVIDVTAGRVIGSSVLPALPSTTADGRPATRIAPEIDLAPSGGAVLVSDFWYVADDREPPTSGVDHWSASFDGTNVSGFASVGATSSDDCVVLARGVVDASSSWVLCSSNGRVRFDRIGRDGTAIGSTDLPAFDGLAAAQLDGTGEHLYVWGPVARTLARVDIATGVVSSVTAAATAVASDPVSDVAAALGRWIAPPAAAKVLLEPALAISPDGTRVYALGVDMRSGEAVASRGVFVFDTPTMAQVGHWQPVADLTSITLSPDGAWLYAAGQPLFDAGGTASLDAASISVYATADGSVRLTASSLGNDPISFPGPVLP